MSDNAQSCPGDLTLISSPIRTCGGPTAVGCTSAKFCTDGVSYSQVCGRLRGYQVEITYWCLLSICEWPEKSVPSLTMLMLWCQQLPDTSWSQLIEALKQVKLNRIAKDIEKLLLPVVPAEEPALAQHKIKFLRQNLRPDKLIWKSISEFTIKYTKKMTCKRNQLRRWWELGLSQLCFWNYLLCFWA